MFILNIHKTTGRRFFAGVQHNEKERNMKIRAEHIMIIIASIPYIFGMVRMIMELKRYGKDKKERRSRCIILMMMSMTILYSVFVVKALTVFKYLF